MYKIYNKETKTVHCPKCGKEIAWYSEAIQEHICSSDYVNVGKVCRTCEEDEKVVL